MFDIGFTELVLIAIVSLLVIGPERLPETLRTAGLWLGRIRRGFNEVKRDIERELRTDEILQTLHNERVLKELRETQEQLNALKAPLDAGALLSEEPKEKSPSGPAAPPPGAGKS